MRLFVESLVFTGKLDVVNFTLTRGLDLKKMYHLALFQGFMYYVNDGVYGSFNCLVFDHATVHPEVLDAKGKDAVKFPSSIWGPTCDSLDCISKSVMLPKVGDKVLFEGLGYSF